MVKPFIATYELPLMKIGELASATGLSRDTLRFYEKRGLLLPRRRGNGYRDYPPEAVQWLCYLRSAQQLGFTLAEIEAGMPLLAAPEDSAQELREALRRKLADIDARIAALGVLRAELARELEELGAACPLRQ
jgi:DNA-binding transcriptional MerR regulator